MAAKNTKSEGQLLAEFFQYFGYSFYYKKQEINPRLGVIRSRSVPTPPRSKTDSRPKDWSICILDPFIPNRNVAGNCRNNHAIDIQQAFRSAYDALKVCNIDKAFKR
jgi:DNA polymerase sigma